MAKDYPYIVFDAEEGWEPCENLEEAEKFARQLLDDYAQNAADGWSDGVERLAIYQLVPVLTTQETNHLHMTKCKACGGAGSFVGSDSIKYDCPSCDGAGFTDENGNPWGDTTYEETVDYDLLPPAGAPR